MSLYSVELPYQSDAAGYYAALADLPWAVWLDSCGMSRYDIVTAAPQRTLALGEEAHGDPFVLLRNLLGDQVAPIANVPFAGGALGYWSYDLARRMMTLPDIAHATDHLPGQRNCCLGYCAACKANRIFLPILSGCMGT